MAERPRAAAAAVVAALALACQVLVTAPARASGPDPHREAEHILLAERATDQHTIAGPGSSPVPSRSSAPWRALCTIQSPPPFIDDLHPGFYETFCRIRGVDIVATHHTSTEAVYQAAKLVYHMVDERKASLVRAYPDRRAMRIIVIGPGQSWDYLPEYPDGASTWCCPAVVPAGHLLGTDTPGSMVDVHEITHLVNLGVGHADPALQRRIDAAFRSAKARGLWPFDHEGEYGYYAGHNPAEYLAELNVIYRGGNPATWETVNVIDTRTELRLYDPRGYRLIEDTFGNWHATKPDGSTSAAPRSGPDVIRFVATPRTGRAPMTVRLAATAVTTDGSIVSYDWDVDGDGQVDRTSTKPTISHVFSSTGVHMPKVTVTDSAGNSASSWVEVIVGSSYRVNAGGPRATTMHQTWTSDEAERSGLSVGSSQTWKPADWVSIDMSDPSVPPGTDSKIFTSERFAPATTNALRWRFPVEPGRYRVSLYFSEISPEFFANGSRVFDVNIEGRMRLAGLDVYAEVGENAGVVRTFEVRADETLNIDLRRVTGNPSVKGIEIVPL